MVGHIWCCLVVKTLWPCFVAAVKGEPLCGTVLPLGDLRTGHWKNSPFYFKFLLNALENLVQGTRAFVTDEHSWESGLNIMKPVHKHQSLPLKAFICTLFLKNKWNIKYFSEMK